MNGNGIVTKNDVEELLTAYDRAKSTIRGMRERGEVEMGFIVQTTEVCGTAFATGYSRGRFGEMTVLGIPLELIGSFAFKGAAFLGVLGKYAEHGHNIGDGALAGYLVALGVEMGAKAKAAAPATAGYPYEMIGGWGGRPANAGQQSRATPYTVEEVEAMREVARAAA